MLQEARNKIGITQHELAKVLEVDTQFVSNMEREVAPIPAKHFRRLSKALKIPLKTFYKYNVDRYRERLKRIVRHG